MICLTETEQDRKERVPEQEDKWVTVQDLDPLEEVWDHVVAECKEVLEGNFQINPKQKINNASTMQNEKS